MSGIARRTPEGFELYLFGSCLYSHTPHDLDLLLVYDQEKVDAYTAFTMRRKFREEFENELGMVCDLCLLSHHEAIQSRFAEIESAILITPSNS